MRKGGRYVVDESGNKTLVEHTEPTTPKTRPEAQAPVTTSEHYIEDDANENAE